jgi:hypothetical protein
VQKTDRHNPYLRERDSVPSASPKALFLVREEPTPLRARDVPDRRAHAAAWRRGHRSVGAGLCLQERDDLRQGRVHNQARLGFIWWVNFTNDCAVI